MSGCSCENYTYPRDCDYCKGFEHGRQKEREQIFELIDKAIAICSFAQIIDLRLLKKQIDKEENYANNKIG